jgi:hypothetical protein
MSRVAILNQCRWVIFFTAALLIASEPTKAAITTVFLDSHSDGNPLTGPSDLTWTNPAKRPWTETDGQVAPMDLDANKGLLICNYPCKNDGTLTVNFTGDLWNSRHGFIVFRYSSPTSFYAVSIEKGGVNSNLYFFVDTLANVTSSLLIKKNFSVGDIVNLEIILKDSVFTFYSNKVLLTTVKNAAHRSGKVGYGYNNQWEKYINFNDIAWAEEADGPPEILTSPASAAFNTDDSIALKVSVRAIPAATYQWYHSGEVIPAATDTVFTIRNMQIADSGNYYLIANNSFGVDTSATTRIIVYQRPAITRQPANLATYEEMPAVFSIADSGDITAIQWQRMNRDATTWTAISAANKDTLRLATASISADSAAQFRCVVTGRLGFTLTSNVVTLSVTKIPIAPAFTAEPFSAAVAVGKALVDSCVVTGLPTPVVKWYFIPPTTGIPDSVAAGFKLSIPVAVKKDSGSYFCIAGNSAGSAVSDTILVRVLTPAQISMEPAGRMLVDGQPAVFTLDAHGDALTYTWFKNNGINLVQPSQPSLRIERVTPADSGSTYYCIIANAVSADTSARALLQVGRFSNPFLLRASRADPHDNSRVLLSVKSTVNLDNFLHTPQPLALWADSVIVVYASRGYAPSIALADGAKTTIAIADIAATAADSLTKEITIPALAAPADSFYYFSYSLAWHNPDSILQLTNATRLMMRDTVRPANNAIVRGIYYPKSDSADIIIANPTFFSTWDQNITIRLSTLSDMSQPFYDMTVAVATLINRTSPCSLKVRNPAFVGETDTIFCHWFVTGVNGRASPSQDASFIVGWPRPVYTGSFTADATNRSDWIILRWDPPATGADSIRIWWDSEKPIPLVHTTSSLPAEQALWPATNASRDTLTGLSASTAYYFGLQYYRDGMWSKISGQSSDSARTIMFGNSIQIPNTVTIDTAWFDTIHNTIEVAWRIDTSAIQAPLSIETGYQCNISAATVDTLPPKQWTKVAKTSERLSIEIGTGIQFDTTWTVGFWVRGVLPDLGPGRPTGPGDSVIYKVKINRFTWQTVTYFPIDTQWIYAANSYIVLRKADRPVGSNNIDTLRAYRPTEGFLSGMSQAGIGFSFSQKLRTTPFYIGIRPAPLPTGRSLADLRLYRDSAGVPLVERGSFIEKGVVWIKTNQLEFPFILLADTTRPRVIFNSELCDTSQIALPNSAIATVFNVSDNIANLICLFGWGRGNEGYNTVINDTLNTTTATKSYVIPAAGVSELFGVRARIIVSDGVHTDTINVSRRVRSASGDEFTIPANHWIPLRTTTELDEATCEKALLSLNENADAWRYDNTKFRLFRWLEKNGGKREWVEYDEASATEFEFRPTSLLWLKTAKPAFFVLKNGITTSLKQPAAIVLKSREWTDLASPYKFDVRMADIADATGAAFDSCEIYHWNATDSTYVAEQAYLPGFDDPQTQTMIYSPLTDGYTIYNRLATNITLRIPPVPPALSTAKSGALNKECAPVSVICLTWSSPLDGHEQHILCGLDDPADPHTPKWFHLPPSLTACGIALRDTGSGETYGHVRLPSPTNGGCAVNAVVFNNSTQPQTFRYCLDNLKSLPSGMAARILNRQSHCYEDTAVGNGWLTCTLAPNSTTDRWIVIGTSDYLQRFRTAGGLGSLKLQAPFPNPSRGMLSLRYVLPWSDVREVRFSVYTLAGQEVWRHVIRAALPAGAGTVRWDGRDSHQRSMPPGVYIVRMNIMRSGGSVIMAKEVRITFLGR